VGWYRGYGWYVFSFVASRVNADSSGEVRAALEAASRLPYEIRGQIETLSNTASPPPDALRKQ
jgi:hypothetical protein